MDGETLSLACRSNLPIGVYVMQGWGDCPYVMQGWGDCPSSSLRAWIHRIAFARSVFAVIAAVTAVVAFVLIAG
ncbi:protein of unknown function [Cupriavidus neocaledonicus]|uniref:Uncharacterized protein n=1 Tax=Cupriavidus neocaledonicus TaxID=1040979 RepID=A0A375H826_9BURK|nr:hypothetical protein CBM2605_A140119 [Cupriavidus neocaledonicus]SPD46633.1 protein of unknown function [Cupriavidus neocaledonicus]